jgi:hypothetical protein
MSLEESIIRIYCAVEEILDGLRLLSRGFFPELSDSEVLTMEIVGEMQGRHTDAAIWRYFRDHWREWFPALGSRGNFAKHCANLRFAKERILAALFPADSCLHVIDGVPMPICRKARGFRCKSLKGEAAWGYCAAKEEYYYGMRGHPVIDRDGFVVHCTFTAPDEDERSVLDNLRGKIRGMLLGDKGFLGKERRESLLRDGIDLRTLKRNNMPENRPKRILEWISKTRKTVETAISILTEMFAFNRIKARDVIISSIRPPEKS